MIEDLYNNNINIKLSDFIGIFLMHFDKTCLLFKQFYEELCKDIGIYDFRGKPFILIF
jgi:hypothetical protein